MDYLSSIYCLAAPSREQNRTLYLQGGGPVFGVTAPRPPAPHGSPSTADPFYNVFLLFLGGLLFLRMGGAVCVATFCCEGDGAGRGGSGAGPAPLPTGVIWVWKEIISLILIYFFWESPLMRISFLTNCFASASKWNNYICCKSAKENSSAAVKELPTFPWYLNKFHYVKY